MYIWKILDCQITVLKIILPCAWAETHGKVNMHTATHLVCRVPYGTHGKCYGILADVTFPSVCRVSCMYHTVKPGICRVYYFAVCFLAKHTTNRLICRVLFVCRVLLFGHTANEHICRALGKKTHGKCLVLPCAMCTTHGKHLKM